MTLVINLKTYSEGLGDQALSLVRYAEEVNRETQVPVVLAVQATDLQRIALSTSLPIFSQHVDPITPGAHTGHLLPEAVKKAGAVGTFLNHAERKLDDETLKKTILRCQEVGLRSLVCTDSLDQAQQLLSLHPEYLAFEDPALIGTLESISQKQPDTLRQFAALFQGSSTIPLCGAGVATGQDLAVAKQLGMHGGLVATAVVKAEDPLSVMRDLVRGIQKQ